MGRVMVWWIAAAWCIGRMLCKRTRGRRSIQLIDDKELHRSEACSWRQWAFENNKNLLHEQITEDDDYDDQLSVYWFHWVWVNKIEKYKHNTVS